MSDRIDLLTTLRGSTTSAVRPSIPSPSPAADSRPIPPPPTAANLHGFELEVHDIVSDIGMAVIHLSPGMSDSAIEWINRVEARLIILENNLNNAARGMSHRGRR